METSNILKSFELQDNLNSKIWKKTAENSYVLSAKVREKLLDALNHGSSGVYDLHEYLDKEYSSLITSFKVNEVFEDGSLSWDITVERVLSKKEKDYIIDYLWGQCSDGWGEGFEQHPFMMKKGTEFYYSPWNGNRKQKPEFE